MWIVVGCMLGACSEAGPAADDRDAGLFATDAFQAADARVEDASTADAETPDLGVKDAGSIEDAAEPDASPEPDAAELEDAGGPLACPTVGPAVSLGTISEPELAELSGIAVGRVNPDVYWAHNDSSAVLFAIDRTTTELRARYTLVDSNDDEYGDGDVEDIAIRALSTGGAEIYLGDIGDGHPGPRMHIYRVIEPVLTAAVVDDTLEAEMMEVRAGQIVNAEALLVDPFDGSLVVLQKDQSSDACELGVFAVGTLVQPSCAVTVPGIENPSGADVSPDGNYVAVRNETSASIWIRPAGAALVEAFNQPPCAFLTISPTDECNGEALAFAPDGLSLISASEIVLCPTANVHSYTFTP